MPVTAFYNHSEWQGSDFLRAPNWKTFGGSHLTAAVKMIRLLDMPEAIPSSKTLLRSLDW